MAQPRRLLLLIDLQVVVAPDGAWELPGIESVIERSAHLAAEHVGPVLATRHRPVPDDPGTFGPFTARDDLRELTEDAANLAPPLAHLPPVDKASYSAYRCPEVRDALRDVDEVVLCGVETDCCILATAFDLADAQLDVTVVADAVTGPDRRTHEATLQTLGRLGDHFTVRPTHQLEHH